MFTEKELTIIYKACMFTGNKITDMSRECNGFDSINEVMASEAKELFNLARKIAELK